GMLLAYGIAGLVGNFAVAPLLRRSAPAGVLVVSTGIGAGLLAVLVLMRSPFSALLVMLVWGLFVGAVSVTVQSFVNTQASEVIEEGTALNSAVFNAAIASGALVGGVLL